MNLNLQQRDSFTSFLLEIMSGKTKVAPSMLSVMRVNQRLPLGKFVSEKLYPGERDLFKHVGWRTEFPDDMGEYLLKI